MISRFLGRDSDALVNSAGWEQDGLFFGLES